MKWNLDALYTSFDSKEFQEDRKKLLKMIDELESFVKQAIENNLDTVKFISTYLNIREKSSSLHFKLSAFSELSLSVETSNTIALKNKEQLEALNSKFKGADVSFQKWLTKIKNIEELSNKSDIIKEHIFFLKELQESAKHLLSEQEEILIAKMKETGSNAWSTLWNSLTAEHLVEIEINGKKEKLPLAKVRNMYYDSNPKIRKSAYKSEIASYKTIEKTASACLNGVKGEVLTLISLKKYDSVLDKTLKDARMDKETLDAMITAMKEHLNSFRKFYKRKAKLLGHKKLPFYDIFAPIGSIKMRFSFEEAMDFIVENFGTFSKKLSNFAKNAFENNWIDSEPKEGKVGGAFCENLHPIKESRVLTNFEGSFSDVSTVAHELGHAYHGFCLKEETFLNSDYPMPLAETASIFCETIIGNAALKKATKEEKIVILENEISSAGQVIVDILSRFIFESSLFEERKKGSVSVDKLKELMINAQKEAYGDGLDEEILHPYMWLNKPHYYFADYNFYNFPYAFGLLFAKGLYALYLKEGDAFVEKYDKMLALTGKETIKNVVKTMEIDVSSINFWNSSLKIIEKDIEEFLKLTE